MDNDDKMLVGAYAISTYAEILGHLTDLANLQAPVPHVMEGQVRRQLTQLAQVWWSTTHGDPVWHDHHLPRVIEEADDWIGGHHVRLSELLNEGNGGE